MIPYKAYALIPYRRQAADFIHGFAVIYELQFSPKSPSRKTWAFSFVPQAQHHLSVARASFLIFSAQTNDVVPRANDVLRNEVMLRSMMLHYVQMESCIFDLYIVKYMLKGVDIIDKSR